MSRSRHLAPTRQKQLRIKPYVREKSRRRLLRDVDDEGD